MLYYYVDIQQCIYYITTGHILQNNMCSIQFDEELANYSNLILFTVSDILWKLGDPFVSVAHHRIITIGNMKLCEPITPLYPVLWY